MSSRKYSAKADRFIQAGAEALIAQTRREVMYELGRQRDLEVSLMQSGRPMTTDDAHAVSLCFLLMEAASRAHRSQSAQTIIDKQCGVFACVLTGLLPDEIAELHEASTRIMRESVKRRAA